MKKRFPCKRPLKYIPFLPVMILFLFWGGESGEIPPMGHITLLLIAILVSVLINNRYLAEEVKINLENQIDLRTGELRESEARYRSLVNNIPGVTYRCLLDDMWTMLFISNEIERLTGYGAGDFINNQKRTFKSILYKDNPPSVNNRSALAERRDTSFRLEYRVTNRDGQVRWVLDKGSLWLNNKGTEPFIDGVMIDITEEKALAQAREELEEQFRQAQKMESVGRLAAGIAHDLNNLLTPVMGYAELLHSHVSGNEEAREYTREMIKATIMARDLIQQLLTYSRHQNINYASIDINSLLLSLRELLGKTLRDNIELIIITDPRLPVIRGDRNQLEQVIMNLAVNARDAMNQGGTLTMETLREGNRVLIKVSDTGKGMDKETMEHIFEPFYTTKGLKGTGLGLATVYAIVKQHQGLLKVESHPDRGTCLTLSLPL